MQNIQQNFKLKNAYRICACKQVEQKEWRRDLNHTGGASQSGGIARTGIASGVKCRGVSFATVAEFVAANTLVHDKRARAG